MYFAYAFIRSEKRISWHLFALIAVLIPTAFMTEGWLDFFSSAWAMSIILFFYFLNNKLPGKKRNTILLFIIFNIVAAIYVYVKFTYIGFTHQSGESKVVFSYGLEYFWRGLEDLISNYFTNLYATLTNFLPPAFTTSNALYQYEKLQEHNNNLLRGHFIYYWRYFAGVFATLFYVFFTRILRKVFAHKAASLIPLALFMTMVAVNSPTHTIVVHHHWKAMPVLGYYVEQGVLGLSLAIAYGFHLLWNNSENKKVVFLLASLFVLIVLYSSVRRPNYLWHMIEMVGLDHQGPYPNPLAVTIIKIRILFPGFLLK